MIDKPLTLYSLNNLDVSLYYGLAPYPCIYKGGEFDDDNGKLCLTQYYVTKLPFYLNLTVI